MLRFLIVCTVPVFVLFWGCNSAIYEIEELEEVVEVAPDTPVVKTGIIVEEPKVETVAEYKIKDERDIPKMYAVQIGAFIDKMNADKYFNDVNKAVNGNLYIKNFSGLYKVRVGDYNQISEAKLILEKLVNLGYTDAFLVELAYSPSEE